MRSHTIVLFGVILENAASTAEVAASAIASRTASDIVPLSALLSVPPPKSPPSIGAATLARSFGACRSRPSRARRRRGRSRPRR